jgi:hypothetical protein
MKSLVLLGCVGLVVACGSSSGTRVDGMQATPLPLGAPQVPQQPTDSVPPANSQTAPLTQQAPLNPQQAPLSSPAATVTCDQVATAVRAAGCTISNQDLEDCASSTAAGARCGTEYQGVLLCLTRNTACDANGDLKVTTCTAELTTYARCMQVSQATCVSPSCNCSDACSRCECRMTTNDNLTCTNECAVTN